MDLLPCLQQFVMVFLDDSVGAQYVLGLHAVHCSRETAY
jgi:hypothetical protein